MSQESQSSQSRSSKSRVRYLLALGIVFVLPVISYFAYDLSKPLLDPCESLFRQTQLSLDSKISWLKSEGHMQIKPEKIQQLGERAQFVALNLKACCTVLNAGQLNPEQFLQCKEKAFAYESGVEKVVNLVKQTKENAGDVTQQESTAAELDTLLEKVQVTSRKFNHEIVEIRRQHQYDLLQSNPADQLELEGQEAEPNDTILSPNILPMEQWISNEITENTDKDVFTFTTPKVHRDWIKIELKNLSTSLRPRIDLYDVNKNHIQELARNTGGSDATMWFMSAPESTFFVKISSHYSNNSGQYGLLISAKKAYDNLEPNQTILRATEIETKGVYSLNLTDGGDIDYFKFTASQSGTLNVRFENRSTGINPIMSLFDQNKTHIQQNGNDTGGGDVTLSYPIEQGKLYYLKVHDHYTNNYGDYQLSLFVEN